jgi:hypothetical protein
MMFEIIRHGWPVKGGLVIPVGTIIGQSFPPENLDWTNYWSTYLNGQIPPNAQALDQQCWNAMTTLYPKWALISGPGIDRSQGTDFKPT